MPDIEDDLRGIVIRSITALASVCDHARSIDGQGFSKATAGPGHEIAALGSNLWTPEYWDYAARLASHHSRQLEKSGHLDEMDAARLRAAIDARHVAAPEIQTNWIDVGDIDGRMTVVLSMPSEERLPKILKNLPESDVYRPAGAGRLWRVSPEWAFAAEPFLDGFDRVGDGVREAVRESSRLATPEQRMLATDLPLVRFDAGKGEFTFKFAYDRNFVDDAKRHGGRFEKGASWKDCTAFLPADRLGAAFVDGLVAGGQGAVLHAESVQPLEEARQKEPSAEALARTAEPRLVFEGPSDGRIRATMTRYSAEFVQALKGVPGRVYDEGSWLIPASKESAELLVSRLDGLETAGAAEAAADVRALAERFVEDAQAPIASLSIEEGGGKFVTVSMSCYVAEWVDSIRNLPKGDRRYDAENKAWKVRKDDATFSALLDRLQDASGRLGNPAYFATAIGTVEKHLEDIRSRDDDEAPSMRL